MPDEPTIGEILIEMGRFARRTREALGLSLEEASRRSNFLSSDEIAAFEDGTKDDPLIEHVFALAAVLRIEPGDFFSVAKLVIPSNSDEPSHWAWNEDVRGGTDAAAAGTQAPRMGQVPPSGPRGHL